jgi:hypothetical protein
MGASIESVASASIQISFEKALYILAHFQSNFSSDAKKPCIVRYRARKGQIHNIICHPAPYETGPFMPWLSTKPGNIDENIVYCLGAEKNATLPGVSTRL